MRSIIAVVLLLVVTGAGAQTPTPGPYPALPAVCKAAIFDWEAIGGAAIAGHIPPRLVAQAEKATEACLDQLINDSPYLDQPSDGKRIVSTCETACTKACDPWNVPKCMANCVTTGQPDCTATPAPQSCTGECGSKCPPWKSPSKYANCLVSCADTGHWACYSDAEPGGCLR